MNNETIGKKNLIHKLYGGLNMSWPVVLLYAVFAAALTFAFLVLPVFQDTSFARMGVHLEAWFFLAIIVMALAVPRIDIMSTQFLPDDPVFTEEAVVKAEEGAFAEVSLAGTGEDSRVLIHATSFGTMDFSVLDGDAEYLYTLEVYEDEGGHTKIRITER